MQSFSRGIAPSQDMPACTPKKISKHIGPACNLPRHPAAAGCQQQPCSSMCSVCVQQIGPCRTRDAAVGRPCDACWGKKWRAKRGTQDAPVMPPLGGQPSASMPSSAAAEAPSFSRRALYAGSAQALRHSPQTPPYDRLLPPANLKA
jgi:hypothetical protein